MANVHYFNKITACLIITTSNTGVQQRARMLRGLDASSWHLLSSRQPYLVAWMTILQLHSKTQSGVEDEVCFITNLGAKHDLKRVLLIAFSYATWCEYSCIVTTLLMGLIVEHCLRPLWDVF